MENYEGERGYKEEPDRAGFMPTDAPVSFLAARVRDSQQRTDWWSETQHVLTISTKHLYSEAPENHPNMFRLHYCFQLDKKTTSSLLCCLVFFWKTCPATTCCLYTCGQNYHPMANFAATLAILIKPNRFFKAFFSRQLASLWVGLKDILDGGCKYI